MDADEHEAIMLVRFMLGAGVLADRGAEDWGAILPSDEVGLLLRSTFSNPFKPVVDRDNRPVWPDRSEVWITADSLYPGNGGGAVLGSVRPPPPAHRIGP